jgi:hypothetical protein
MISLVQVKIKCRIELTDKVPKTKNNKLISQLHNKLIKISNNHNRKSKVRSKLKDLKLQKVEN